MLVWAIWPVVARTKASQSPGTTGLTLHQASGRCPGFLRLCGGRHPGTVSTGPEERTLEPDARGRCPAPCDSQRWMSQRWGSRHGHQGSDPAQRADT